MADSRVCWFRFGIVPNQHTGSGSAAVFVGMAHGLPERFYPPISAAVRKGVLYTREIFVLRHQRRRTSRHSLFCMGTAGGAFVLFYMLVILYERYFPALYCLYPIEWFAPGHTWVFGDTGIIAMVVGLILITGILYGNILRRCIDRA